MKLKITGLVLGLQLVTTPILAMPAGWLTPFLNESAKASWTARSANITAAINTLNQTSDIPTFVQNYKNACRGILGEHMRGGLPVWAQTSQSSACQVADYLDSFVKRERTNIRYCQVLNGAINGLNRGKGTNEGQHLQPQLDELHSALLRLKGVQINSEGGLVRTENDIVFFRARQLQCN